MPLSIDMDELGDLMWKDEYNGMAEAYVRAIEGVAAEGVAAVKITENDGRLSARFIDRSELYLS